MWEAPDLFRTAPSAGSQKGDIAGARGSCLALLDWFWGLRFGCWEETKKKAAEGIPRRRTGPAWCGLGFDRVAALPVLAFDGRDRQAHPFTDRAGKEPTQGMRLPAGRFHGVD
jgi:hypothetical protein